MSATARAATVRKLRESGYHDGYAGRPAKRLDAAYQAAWRRGREARAAEHGPNAGAA